MLMTFRKLHEFCSWRILLGRSEFCRGYLSHGQPVLRVVSDAACSDDQVFRRACLIARFNENRAAQEIMLNSRRYSSTLYLWLLKKQLPQENSKCYANAFYQNDQSLMFLLLRFCRQTTSFSSIACPDDSVIDQLSGLIVSDSVISRLSKASDSYLAELLRALLAVSHQRHSKYDTSSVVALRSAFDNECVGRISHWSVDTILSFLDMWFHLLARRSLFFCISLNCLCEKASEWTASQLVQIMFYINATRSMPSKFQSEIECRVLDLLGELSIDEIGIVCLAFFKSKTPISNSRLRACLVERLEQDHLEARQEMLGSILKCLRLSLLSSEHRVIVRLYNSLLPNVRKFNKFSIAAFMALGSKTDTFHRRALFCCFGQLMSQLQSLRLKDMERMLMCLFKFNVQVSAADLNAIVAELEKPERRAELIKYALSFISLLTHLGFFQCYPASLIHTAYWIASEMDISGQVTESIVKLDHILRVENRKLCQPLPNQMVDWTFKNDLSKLVNRGPEKRMTFLEAFTWDIYRSLCRLYHTDKHIALINVLPHFVTRDIVVCLNRYGYPLSLPSDYLNLSPISIKWLPQSRQHSSNGTEGSAAGVDGRSVINDDRIWLCVVPNLRLINNIRAPKGIHLYRIRQLQALGYRTIEVLPESREANMFENALRNKILCVMSDYSISVHNSGTSH